MINTKTETVKTCDQIDEQHGNLSVDARAKIVEWMLEGFINGGEKNEE